MTSPDQRTTRRPTLAHRAEYYSLRAMLAGLERLPWETACSIGERLGRLGYRPFGVRKDVVERQIAAAFPELDHDGVQGIARGAYSHLGRTAVEAALLPSLGKNAVLDLVEIADGWEHLATIASAGRGGLAVAAHHGNWELLGAYLAAREVRPEVVVRGMGNKLFENYLNANREKLGLTVMHDSVAVRRTARALREGRIVAMLADQGVLGLASSFVPFFGRPAKTPRGPAVFALRLNVPLVFAAPIRQPNGRYHFVFERVEVARTGDRERDIDTI